LRMRQPHCLWQRGLWQPNAVLHTVAKRRVP